MAIMKVVQFRISFFLSAVGSWRFHGFLLHICLTHPGLNGKSRNENLTFFSIRVHLSHLLIINHFFVISDRAVEDFKDWTNWLLYRGGIGVNGKESWEAWWDEEMVCTSFLQSSFIWQR